MRLMKCARLGFAAVTASAVLAVPAVSAQAATGPANVQATHAYLFDETAHKALWSRDGYTKVPIASLTKLMTAYTVIHKGNLNRTITITASDAAYPAAHNCTQAYLKAGERITARELLYGMLLPSGCDAAKALSEAYGPGNAAFVSAMNRNAATFGLTSTHYTSVDGVHVQGRSDGWSTARDQVRLALFTMSDPILRDVVGTRTHTLVASKLHRGHTWTNTNLLFGKYPGVIGIKTGFTNAAGYCLLFSAVRNGRTLTGVVLHSTIDAPGVRFTDAGAILDWAFQTHTPMTLTNARVIPGVTTD